jgi:hypothetical protein
MRFPNRLSYIGINYDPPYSMIILRFSLYLPDLLSTYGTSEIVLYYIMILYYLADWLSDEMREFIRAPGTLLKFTADALLSRI